MLSAENVIDFLSFYTENNNHSASSSNQRLAILKSLARHAGYLYPEDIDLMKRISLISPKTAVKKIVQYLEYSDMKTLLECSKNKGDLGLRDYTIILFMYNTGARVSEVTGLNISQLSLDSCPCVLLYGKGKKERIIPLWQELVSPLKKMIEGRTSQGDAPVFINRNGGPFFYFPEKFSPPQTGEFFESQKEEHFHFSKNSPGETGTSFCLKKEFEHRENGRKEIRTSGLYT